MDKNQNPFQSPQADVFALPRDGEAGARSEEIRREYLNHEASVKAVGFLYYLGAIFLAIAAFATFASVPILAFVLMPFAIAAGVIGYGFRALQGWIRIPVAILSGLGILGNVLTIVNPQPGNPGGPGGAIVGLIINIYIINLVWSAKGKFVCSAEYRAIIAETPHIKYRTSLIIKILAGFLLFVIVVGILAFILSGPPIRH